MLEGLISKVKQRVAAWAITEQTVEDQINSMLWNELAAIRYDREGLNEAVLEDADEKDWHPLNSREYLKAKEDRDKARILVQTQAHCRRALKLYEDYVFGPEFTCSLKLADPDKEATAGDKKVIQDAETIWQEFLDHNRKAWTPDEFGRRVWRDGEQFTRFFEDSYPIKVRFIDPEYIGDPDNQGEDGHQGIITDPNDVATPKFYVEIDENNQFVAKIDAKQILHTKIDCDSTEKRGRTRFRSVIHIGRLLELGIDTEVILRLCQASIVMQKKIDGGTRSARRIMNNAVTSTTMVRDETALKRERFRPGTILTTPKGVEVEFKQPKGDFANSTPLYQMLISHIGAATGWTYSMLSGDTSESNFAAALAAESPVLQMVDSERNFFRGDFREIYKRVMEHAIDKGVLKGVTKDTIWKRFKMSCHFRDIVSRDPLKDAQASNIHIMNGSISRTEGSRRAGADPDQMRREIREENESGLYNPAYANQNPGNDDKADSSKANAKASGTNQGGDEPIQHKDKLS